MGTGCTGCIARKSGCIRGSGMWMQLGAFLLLFKLLLLKEESKDATSATTPSLGVREDVPTNWLHFESGAMQPLRGAVS